jgi:hypothetical protein
VREIVAVQVLPGIRFPEVLSEPKDDEIANSFLLPDAALAENPRGRIPLS